MKFTKPLKAALISTGIIAGTVGLMLPSTHTNTSCQTIADVSTAPQCVNANQQSWFSWFQGKSRSTQFHFVDLLELLTRLSPAKAN